jgi:hypothetical protein
MNPVRLSDLNLLKIGNEIQLTGAIYSGDGEHYLVVLPEEHGEDFSRAKLLEMDFTDWETFLKQTDFVEVQISKVDEFTGKLVKAIVRKTTRQIEQDVSWRVYRRDGFACRYCGKNDVPLTVDHLVLWEEGGPSTEANLVSSCKKCNRTRGNTQYSVWLQSHYYNKVSRNLSRDILQKNVDLIPTLDKIERLKFKRSR